MPIYQSPYGSAGGSSSRTGYWNQPSGGGSVVQADGGPQPKPASDPFNGPGSIDFDLTDPAQAVDEAGQESADVFRGFKNFLFGTDKPDPSGKRGGIVGDIPLLGDLGRGVGNVAASGLDVLGEGVNRVGGLLERVPNFAATDEQKQQIMDRFNALPDDSKSKQDALKKIDEDTGFSSDVSHLSYMSQALSKYEEESGSTDLYTGLFKPAASIGDAFGNLLGLMGAGQRLTERGIAGAGKPGEGGMNQLQTILAVGNGQATWTADDPGLTPVEQQVFDMYTSGKWSEDQALNFLSSHGAGLSHNKALEITGNVFLDPLMAGSVGATALAKLGKAGVILANIQKDASAALAAEKALGAGADASKLAELEDAVAKAGQGMKAKDSAAARDVLGNLAERKFVGDIARKYGEFYGSLGEGSQIGRMAKITRTVIDPMHAWGSNPRVQESIEEGSQEAVRAVVNAHGEFTNMQIGHHLAEMEGMGQEFVDKYTSGLAAYAGHALRRVAGRQYRAVQMLGGKADRLIETKPFEAIRDVMSNVRKRSMTQLEEEAGRFIQRQWNESDDANLADRLATLWGGKTKDEWIEELKNTKRWTAEKKSLMHSATYGSAIRQLHDARALVRESGQAGNFTDRLHKLVLLNKRTLTDLGADGIVERLTSAASMDAKLAIIEEAKRLYPELRNFVSDPTHIPTTVDEFIDMLGRRKNFLPAQIRDAERVGLPEALAAFDEKTRNVFTIGFRPDDEYLWGLERNSDGVLREVGDPWFDQVSENLQGYMPVRSPAFNVAGKPIIGKAIGRAARMLDAAEASGRIAMHGVTGAMVKEAARGRFIQSVTSKYAESGLSQTQVEGIWKALMDKVDDSENISGIRGLSRDAIWSAAKAVIPDYAERAGLDRRALLVHVLDSYNGDIRYVGLTQKFTGKTKTLAAQLTGANTAGVISEHMWPLLKFRLNAFFQLQEKIEPWVLNASRGVSVAIGRKANDADKLTAALYRNFVDKNLINMADNDIAELARKMGWGKGMEAASRQESGKVAFLRSKLEAMTEVQGIKQLNMLRTFRGGLGREMRAVWDESNPGEWDKMLRQARATAGVAIDEDEFAVRMAAENLAANDIFVRRVKNGEALDVDFRKSITVGQHAAPQSLGELRPLRLDDMVSDLALRDRNGLDLTTSMQLREALADQRMDLATVSRALRETGAHPDYVARVESALNFSWPKFWQDAQDAFSLTAEERTRFESMFSQIAQNRGMTPVEYMSQVYSPQIANRGEHAVGSLGNLVEFTRAGRTESVPDLAHLVGGDMYSTVNDLYRQMGAIMAHHLDPSAKRAFLLDINPALRDQARRGEILTGLDEIESMWTSEATDAMSDRIMHFVHGQPGTGAHVPVANEATGVARIRDGATEWRAQAGRPRNMQRVVYENDDALAQQAAQAFDELPRSFTHVATPEQLAERIDPAVVASVSRSTSVGLTGLRAEAAALPKTVRSASEAYVVESRKMYRYLTETLGVQVKPVRKAAPYATADALRADLARGRIKVPDSGYFHPIFNNDDLFMQRAVQDAFGHGQEANALGSHDAVFSAAAMYSDEARSVMLSDTFARSAWEAHSPEVIQQAVAEPRTVGEYEARWGRSAARPARAAAPIGTRFISRSLGNGVRALPEDVQQEIVGTLGSLRNQFPTVPLEGVDVAPIAMSDNAVTADYHLGDPTIMLSPEAGWQADDTVRAATRQARVERRALEDESLARGAQSVREFVSQSPTGDLVHEFGHVVDIHLHNQYAIANGAAESGRYLHEPLAELLDQFRQGPHAKVSMYSTAAVTHPVIPQAEAFAELFDLSFNPEHADIVLSGTLDPEVQSYINAFRKELKAAGVYSPDGVEPALNPLAGQTVAAANAATPGAVRAEHRMGTLPQPLIDQMTEAFLGSGRFAESNPDVARMASYLHEHMQAMTAHVLREGEAGDINGIFEAMSGMPVSESAPFNFTEARLWDAATSAMASKWEDAFRLQYFAQNRSMFQRSLNHPMFGLYPASYMWGKIGPELIRFMATEPFGMKTGAMLYTLADFQKAIAMQRQYDPEFDGVMDELGTNAAIGFLGYMLPATPWSVPSSYPGWLRDMAGQGLDNEALAAEGGYVNDPDFMGPLNSVVKKAFPYTTTVPWFGRALEAMPWNQETEPPPTSMDAMGNQPEPAAPEEPDLSEPTAATGLGVVLGNQIRDLQAILH